MMSEVENNAISLLRFDENFAFFLFFFIAIYQVIVFLFFKCFDFFRSNVSTIKERRRGDSLVDVPPSISVHFLSSNMLDV